MTKQLVPINTANDTFQVWVDRFNEVISLANTEVVTVNTTSGVSTGNGFVNGFFGSNTLVTTNLRGGNISTSGILTITSNTNIDSSFLSVGNSTANVSILGSNITLSNSVVNYTLLLPNTAQKAANNFFLNANGQWTTVDVEIINVAGSNTNIQYNNSNSFAGSNSFTFDNTSNTVSVGNSTANVNISSSTFRLINSTANVTLVPNLISVGNSSANSRINEVSVISANGIFSVSVNTTTSFVSNGSAASPSYTFSSDTNSGFYRSADNQLALSLDGTDRVIFSTSNTLFSSNTVTIGNTVYVVANGNIGIGTAGPTVKLEVNGAATVGGALTGGSIISSSNTLTVGTSAFFVSNGNVGIGNSTPASKLVVSGNATVTSSFSANNLTATSNGLTVGTAAYFVSNGNVGIGNSSPTDKLKVNGVVADSSGDVRTVPISAKTSTYQLTSNDAGLCISTNASITVNGAVLSSGFVTSIFNNSAASITITQGSGATMYLAGSSTTENRTLAQKGLATILCTGSNSFVISGTGVS